MRNTFVLFHRWAGLFIAVFLFVAGLTGAVISWDHELDEWLNPHLYDAPAQSSGKPLAPLELLAKVEAADPRVKVTFLPLHHEEGHNTEIGVQPRVDPETGELYPIDYNQAFVDPATGNIVGKRFWGAISLDTENLLPFLYKLHYSMHIPDVANIDRWGVWFMGIVGIVWLFDCFVGFYLTLPARVRRNGATRVVAEGEALLEEPLPDAARRSWWQRWKPAWQIKRGASAYRFNLDLHRAFGLWLWAMLFIIAFTSVSMNLGTEVVRPILNSISKLTPDAFDDRAPTPLNKPIAADVSFATAIDTAKTEALRRGWTEPAGGAFSMASSTESTPSCSTSRAMSTVRPASLRCCSSTARVARRTADACRGRARRRMSSCNCSSRCIRVESPEFRAEYSCRSWGLSWPCCL
jgi:uncharacterized iron-regulated membrane protein